MTARERKRFLICIGLSLVVGLLVSVAYVYRGHPLFQGLEAQQRLLDDATVFRSRDGDRATKVALVHIDEKTVAGLRQQFGRPFSWPRSLHAQVLRQLTDAGARVVAYDVLFDAPACPGASAAPCAEDDAFAGAVEYARARAGGGTQVIFAMAGEAPQAPGPDQPISFKDAISPIPALASKATALAHIHPFPDSDGTVRRMPLIASIAGQEVPALALQGAASYLRRAKAVDGRQGNTLLFGGRPIPIDEHYRTVINYQGKPSHLPEQLGPGPVPVISMIDVLNNTFDKALVKDKLVFVGLTAIGFADDWQAPTSIAGTKMSGVEVHAQTAEMLLRGAFLAEQSSPTTIAVILILAMVPGIILARFQPFFAAGVTLALFVAYVIFVVVYSQLSVGQMERGTTFTLFNSVHPGVAMVLSFVVVMLYRIVFEQAEQRATKGVMGKYLSPSVMTEVLKDPDGLRLGGEKRDMSVLFSDIRGFTSVSEKMDPSELVRFLNEYLTEMTDIVFAHHGVLDKYMGDAIMAFWGAPTAQPDHAEQACRAGFQMMRRLRELQPGWSERGLPPLNIGIGINTGPMTVGNVGSNQRFDYTVMGDAVNLGSRLEGVNKEYGTNLIISDGTYAHVEGKFAARFLDLIAVKGKKEPTAIYELMAPLDEPDHLPPAGFLDAWNAAIALYKQQRFEDAKIAFARVLELRPADGPSRAYLVRCDEMVEAPPGSEWDGVYVLTHK